MEEEYIFQDVETEAAMKHALIQKAAEIETSYQFKTHVLESDSQDILGKLLDKKEFKLANLKPKDAKKVIIDLDLASDLMEMGLTESPNLFIKRALLMCNVSRSVEMKQQDKFNEHRDIRESSLVGLKERRSMFGRRQY